MAEAQARAPAARENAHTAMNLSRLSGARGGARRARIRSERGGARWLKLLFAAALVVALYRYASVAAPRPASSNESAGVVPAVSSLPNVRGALSDARERIERAAEAVFRARREEPNLKWLVARLRVAMAPYMLTYLKSTQSPNCFVESPKPLEGCPSDLGGCVSKNSLALAQEHCLTQVDCGGVSQVSDSVFETRKEVVAQASENALRSFIRVVCADEDLSHVLPKKFNAVDVYDDFAATVSAVLDDEDVAHLRAPPLDTREDGSIFISVASYRDATCPTSISRAFERADHPERLSVGVVQQNCVLRVGCMTGTGWSSTRRWVPQIGPDVDCVETFCSSAQGRAHCDAGRVKILRLEERDAFGPFFSRFLNSKLYAGENFYLQIDAHTDFRVGWDTELVEQMHSTPSYPMSVISNYPPSGNVMEHAEWPRDTGERGAPPSALCKCTFEDAGAGTKQTARLSSVNRRFNNDDGIPRRSVFVAAGFLVAHGSIVANVGFDPFLPWVFMGEEIALSVRFWTSGYDLYAPTMDFLKHDYVRKEAPKFWESVDMLFSARNSHNNLASHIISRIHDLLGMGSSGGSLGLRKSEFFLGHSRTLEEFLEFAGLDLGDPSKPSQVPPQWCLTGGAPKNVASHGVYDAKLKAALRAVDPVF